jgi:hypothetical protein
MKKFAVLFCLVGLMSFNTSFAQDTTRMQRPLFFQVDFAVGATQRTSGYFSAIARFYHEKSFVSIGTGGFNYKPDNLPPDFNPGWYGSYNLNSTNLYFVGYGTFLPSAHKPKRILLEAGAGIGNHRKAVNYTPVNPVTQIFFGFITSSYDYSYKNEFTVCLHLLAKAELCSRVLSVGVNLEALATTSTSSIGVGISFGLGRMRKRNS